MSDVVNLSKGERISLSKLQPGSTKWKVGLFWNIRVGMGDAFDLDASAVVLGADDKAIRTTMMVKQGDGTLQPKPGQPYFVFFNMPSDQAGAVKSLGDNRTGEGEGDDEVIELDLSLLPADATQVIFVVTIYEAAAKGQTFGQVPKAGIRIYDGTGAQKGQYDLSEDASNADTVVYARVYKHGDEWRFGVLEQSFSGGLPAVAKAYNIPA